MASVHPRKNKSGDVTAWLVKWRLGGARDGAQQTERFDPTEEGRESAEVFRDAVNEAGQQWPLGWVKGKGLIGEDAPEEDPELCYRFDRYALAMYEGKTGIEEQYRQDCLRDLRRWLFPTFGNCDIRSTVHFNGDTVTAWVRNLEQTMVRKGRAPKEGPGKLRRMSPKTIRNLHGLLFTVLEKAVIAEPPLRLRNPCVLTKLPRIDDDGADGVEDITFLNPDEVAGLISCMERRSDQLLATVKYGTGLRWGEVSALAPASLENWGTSRPALRVMQAWKRDGHGGYKLGKPKSARSRRTVRVPSEVFVAIEELGGPDNDDPLRLYFTGDETGKRLHYSSFYDRWQRAVHRAKAAGYIPSQKMPTPHDLRHSHAAVLLSEGRGLEYVKVRLGHESIQTTSNTYGHLLPEADDEAMDIIDRSLNRPQSPAPTLPALPAPRPGEDRSTVHVLLLPGGLQQAFWRDDFARLVAAVWEHERRTPARIEERAASLWAARHGGLDGVHETMPGRVELRELGPVVYGADGEQQATTPGAHEVRRRWVWEWEDGYTMEPGLMRAEHRPGALAQTEAYAWGTDERSVKAAFVRARERALRMCGRHPAVMPAPGHAEP